MKIAVIGVKGLPASQGGIEHYCQVMYPKIVAQGHSVDLYARSSYIDQPWFSVTDYQGVKIICLPSLPIRGLDALTSSGLAATVAAFRKYDVIHFHALGPSLFSFIPKLISSAKVMVTCQGLDWQRGKWGKLSSRLIHLGEKLAAKYADNIIVVSQALRAYFQKTYNVKAVYIPNGPGAYAPSDPEFKFIRSLGLEPGKYLLFLGRLVPEKRPELLIEAFRKLQQTDWKLVLAGGNSDTDDYIAELVKTAANDPNIIFAGELKDSRLSETVRGAGLFVLPSDLEGLPLAMLEAMREGIPVLASNIPPHLQLIERDRGFLFQAGNTAACTKAIEGAIALPEERHSRGQKARQHVLANYDWEKITKDNLLVYSQSFQLDETGRVIDSKLHNLLTEFTRQKSVGVEAQQMKNKHKRDKTILVTGGAGYIGSHTVKALLAEGYEVIVLDNLVYGHRELVENVLGVKLIVGDIKDLALLSQIFTEYSIDAVIHFAAYAYVGESVSNPAKYYSNNVLGTFNLLEAMRAASIDKIVFSSTCATYGVPNTMPISEEHLQKPINPYGKSKLMVEELLTDFASAYDLRSVCFRYFNAAGADPDGLLGEDRNPETHLIPLVLLAALGEREAISIFGTDYPTWDGTCVRDYIHVSDLARAHVLGLDYLFQNRESQTFNLGNCNGFSVREIIEAARKVTGETIEVIECDRRPGDPPILVGSSEKARKVLGWEPQYTEIEEIIAHAWQWHLKRHRHQKIEQLPTDVLARIAG